MYVLDGGAESHLPLYLPSDPQAEYLPTHHNLPALSAIAVHMGDMGELVDRLFLDDYRQYAPPFVDR